ncbi:hypothetical protein Ait01nite_078310 [Actinoplanes italicus]|uniref:Secreted protein n=1 Tax=Actinoplanes italicus TaxID=113567 RepID=A0A2T0K3R6_9ACTN|nr:hypothetical protein [Actinoplanes italicus]PRX17527.1 hypothetical protein CLV67_11519 [Actinoplanes italicus]GIE34786.1 hypothetical protein Ait01nite_078310 [Actinoplanes italicus]
MNTAVKLSSYAMGLILIFGAAAGAGRVIGPDQQPEAAPAHGEAHAPAGEADAGHAETEHLPGGLQIAQDGYRLSPVTTRLSTGAAQRFAFQVMGADGKPVVEYTENHDKDLHLILVRRDMSGYQHVHPTLGNDGTWSIPLSVDTPGQYRVLADFQPSAASEALTLGFDVPAPGDYQPVALPEPALTAEVDGYRVTLDGDLQTGALGFTVSRDGKPVTDLEPYLGALGHLVVLREGDLAYLHVHPAREDALAFQAEVPSPGVYRLYLDFQHGGKVRTAEFTATTAGVTQPPAPTDHDADGHSHD